MSPTTTTRIQDPGWKRLLAGAAACLLCAGRLAADDVDQGMFPQIAPYSVLEGETFFGTDVLGAEDLSAEDDCPRIPEPMVFDLVRPLGARRGEFEVNVLGLIPLNRKARSSGIPNPIGLVQGRRPHNEWAPEMEYAVVDGVAVEFELPFEDTDLAAYKLAGQVTFGTAFNQRFVHGAQGILLYDRHTGHWSPVLVYIAGLRVDERWSMLGMYGFRTEIDASDLEERTERLVNYCLFYDVNEHVTLGVESNWSQSLSGRGALFVTPQVHWEITDHWILQSGVGVDFSRRASLPEFAVRLILSF